MRQKSVSTTLRGAEQRLNAVRSIDERLDLGGGFSIQAFRERNAALAGALDDYNRVLGEANAARIQLRTLEADMRDYSERFLAAVAAHFGRDSDVYSKAGGTRKSERKRKGSLHRERVTLDASNADTGKRPSSRAAARAGLAGVSQPAGEGAPESRSADPATR